MTHWRAGSVSRRTMLRAGGLALGAAAVGAALPTPALAAGTAAPPTSYNGWPIGYPPETIDVHTYPVPGSSATLAVKAGDVKTVLIYFAQRFNVEVERLDPAQTEGYQYRKNVNNPSVWSNHASGTAIDLNYEKHPNGKKGTFSPSQVLALRRLLDDCQGVVYWGGDYRGTVDEMHFEINVGPGDARLSNLAYQIEGVGASTKQVALQAQANQCWVTAENAGNSPLIANRTAVGAWERFEYFELSDGGIALRAVNGLFVCADHAGNDPLIANRETRSTWETYSLIPHEGDLISLTSRANGLLVCAEYAGQASLRANRTRVGLWETFKLVTL